MAVSSRGPGVKEAKAVNAWSSLPHRSPSFASAAASPVRSALAGVSGGRRVYEAARTISGAEHAMAGAVRSASGWRFSDII